MSTPLEELIRYRLNRARDTLAEAQTLAGSNHYHGAANRMYYACFYAVNAMLLSDGLSAVKHSGTRSLFNRNYIKTGRISAGSGILYNTLYDMRQTSDYEDLFIIRSEQIETLMPQIKLFLDEIEQFLRVNNF